MIIGLEQRRWHVALPVVAVHHQMLAVELRSQHDLPPAPVGRQPLALHGSGWRTEGRRLLALF